MTKDQLMTLVTCYTEACDDLGEDLFNQTAEQTAAKHKAAKDLWQKIGAEVDRLHSEIANLRLALKWYADGEHFDQCNPQAWDTVSGEPQNWWCDEAGAGMVEDGTLAKKVLAGELTGAQMHADEDEVDPDPHEDPQAIFGDPRA